MAHHFSPQEYAARMALLRKAMRARDIAGLLLHRQESHYWLTGYDSFGYAFYQALIVDADGRVTALVRAPDLRQLQQTSTVTDIRVWTDGPGTDPAAQTVQLCHELGLRGGKIGVEWVAPALSARDGFALRGALTDAGIEAVDTSDLVGRLRVVKSEAEIQYIRKAAMIADNMALAAREKIRPDANEAEILGAMEQANLGAGGDYPANPTVIGSGADALLCRYKTGRRNLLDDDQITLEFAGCWRHYHCCLMRTYRVGKPPSEQARMHDQTRLALARVQEVLHPGRTFGEVFDTHARTLDEAGYRDSRMNASGYSLGATFAPSWMDWPMFYHGNSEPIQTGMVLFCHMIIMNSHDGLAMCWGETFLITDAGPERLSRLADRFDDLG